MAPKKKNSIKILILVVFISLCMGLVGGIITNEYVVSYIFNRFVQGNEEFEPIVKRVVEERVYVEETSVKLAVDRFKESLVNKESDNDGMFGDIAITSDGVVLTLMDEMEGFPFALNEIILEDSEFLNVVEFADLEEIYQGQTVLAVGYTGKGQILLSKGVIMNYFDLKSSIQCSFIGGASLGKFIVINLDGEMIGVGERADSNGISNIISVKVINELLGKWRNW